MRATTVLLVEDNGLLRWWLANSLLREGFVVAAPASVEEAAALADRSDFDVLITDWRLADGFDGLQILNRARLRDPRTRAVLMSAEAGAAFAERAQELGFDLVVEKPFPVSDVVNAVRRMSGHLTPSMAS